MKELFGNISNVWRKHCSDGNDIHTKDSNLLKNCRTWAILKVSQWKWIHTRLRPTPMGGERIKRLLTKALLKRRLFENHEYGLINSFFSQTFTHFAPYPLVKNKRSPAIHVYEILKEIMNSRLQWTRRFQTQTLHILIIHFALTLNKLVFRSAAMKKF